MGYLYNSHMSNYAPASDTKYDCCHGRVHLERLANAQAR